MYISTWCAWSMWCTVYLCAVFPSALCVVVSVCGVAHVCERDLTVHVFTSLTIVLLYRSVARHLTS